MKSLNPLICALLLLALLVGCVPVTAPSASTDAAPTAAATEEAAEEATVETAAQASSDAFPVVIEHKYGSTEIPAKPTRVVTVGLTDQDAVIALGIIPLGTTDWMGLYPAAVGPWAQAQLGGTPPELVGTVEALNFEKITALQPDVIIGLYAGLTQEQYDILSAIAPTVAQPAAYTDYGIPWQELTLTVGKILGLSAEAEGLVADVDAKFAEVRTAHPEFAELVAVIAMPDEGAFWVYGAEDPRSRLLTALGFQLHPDLAELSEGEFAGSISSERIDLLDVDLLIWVTGTREEGLLSEPLYQNLTVAQEGRDIVPSDMAEDVAVATSFVTVLSLPYVIDGLVPRIVEVLANHQAQ